MRRIRQTIQRLKADSKGFTLMEAMMGLVVFSIGILGMAALQTTAVNSNTLAEDVQQNTVEAMAEIEELMATDFLDQRLQDGVNTSEQSPDGKYTIDVEPRDDEAIPGAKRVVVTSKFTPTGGVEQSITLAIFKPDIK
ncbi:MAG: prepilin-type N-terminal cleavage/methylation domain-containing protein [Desulfobacteraceae bacterium]|jgi:prepilin-type N-terminal cleavage/methylation domain-containing protein